MIATLHADNFASPFHHFLATRPPLPLFLPAPLLPSPCRRSVMKHGCQYGTVMNKDLHIHIGECFVACANVCACACTGACRCGSVSVLVWPCATSHRTKTHENITAAVLLSFFLPAAAIPPVPPLPSPLFSSSLKVQRQSNQAVEVEDGGDGLQKHNAALHFSLSNFTHRHKIVRKCSFN